MAPIMHHNLFNVPKDTVTINNTRICPDDTVIPLTQTEDTTYRTVENDQYCYKETRLSPDCYKVYYLPSRCQVRYKHGLTN